MKSYTTDAKDAKNGPLSRLPFDLATHAAEFLDGASMASFSRAARLFKPTALQASSNRLANLLLKYEQAIKTYNPKHVAFKSNNEATLINDARAKIAALQHANSLIAKIMMIELMRNKVLDATFDRRVLMPALKLFQENLLAEFANGNAVLKAKIFSQAMKELEPHLYHEIAPRLLALCDKLFENLKQSQPADNKASDSKAQQPEGCAALIKQYEGLKEKYRDNQDLLADVYSGIFM